MCIYIIFVRIKVGYFEVKLTDVGFVTTLWCFKKEKEKYAFIHMHILL